MSLHGKGLMHNIEALKAELEISSNVLIPFQQSFVSNNYYLANLQNHNKMNLKTWRSFQVVSLEHSSLDKVNY